jgi:hypothetical protein
MNEPITKTMAEKARESIEKGTVEVVKDPIVLDEKGLYSELCYKYHARKYVPASEEMYKMGEFNNGLKEIVEKISKGHGYVKWVLYSVRYDTQDLTEKFRLIRAFSGSSPNLLWHAFDKTQYAVEGKMNIRAYEATVKSPNNGLFKNVPGNFKAILMEVGNIESLKYECFLILSDVPGEGYYLGKPALVKAMIECKPEIFEEPETDLVDVESYEDMVTEVENDLYTSICNIYDIITGADIDTMASHEMILAMVPNIPLTKISLIDKDLSNYTIKDVYCVAAIDIKDAMLTKEYDILDTHFDTILNAFDVEVDLSATERVIEDALLDTDIPIILIPVIDMKDKSSMVLALYIDVNRKWIDIN